MENHRKSINTIWGIKKSKDFLTTAFLDIVVEGYLYFKYIFQQENITTIEKILVVVRLFPSFVDQKGNDTVMAEVSRLELERVIHSFQKGKNLGTNGILIEFYSKYLPLAIPPSFPSS